MRIAIVGAGIVGAATAYELAADGHEVTVFEQRGAAAEEASFAAAGLLAPALLIPWAAPGLGHPIRHPWRSLAGLGWRRRWSQAAKSPQASARLAALECLGRYSQARTRALVQALDVDIETSHGTLVLLRQPADAQRLQPALQALRDAGAALREVDAATARLIEPGLSADTPLAGALYAESGEAGNCRLFAQILRQAAQDLGARFVFNARAQAIASGPARLHIAGENAPRQADAVVLCAGQASAALLRPLGPRLPMEAVHGYTISAPVREDTHAPQGAVIDPLHGITITRQGQRVRVAGGAEVGRGGPEHDPTTLQALYLALSGWFPGGALTSSPQVQVWRGARPTLPDGAPVIGESGVPGLWINAGHGASGWGLACGSARMLADLVARRTPEVAHEALGAGRF